MQDYNPIRGKPAPAHFKKGDLLVLFGELFQRGYANGLVEEAEKFGVTVVRATVGRRDENQNIRKLTPEETEAIPKPFINVPLEAGFDLEKDPTGQTPNDYLKDVKLSSWESAAVPPEALEICRNQGRTRFKKQTAEFMSEVEKLIKPGQHVHFAHLMAGGVPRCKIVLPLMNRVFKGTGDRYISSKSFWESGIGRFLEMNFHEVTAQTFNILIEESTAIREKLKETNGTVSYVAYGYHGTEVIISGTYQWQSYAPYIQGWAKVDLENFAKTWFARGVACCVYNCPEILTNSSSVFKGIEIAVYNLVRALKKDKPNSALTAKISAECERVLKSPDDLEKIYASVDAYFKAPSVQETSLYKNWPQHSKKEQLELTLKTSDDVIDLHKDEKVLMTGTMSELIFKACGYIMFHDGRSPKKPVAWIGHDAVVANLD